MSITDELREWARGFENVWVKPASKEIVVTTGTSMPVDHVNMRLFIEGMLDRVDAEHEREVDALRGDTYLDAVSDSVLAKHGLVRMPVDAEGEPIHIGDVMEWCDSVDVDGDACDVPRDLAKRIRRLAKKEG